MKVTLEKAPAGYCKEAEYRCPKEGESYLVLEQYDGGVIKYRVIKSLIDFKSSYAIVLTPLPPKKRRQIIFTEVDSFEESTKCEFDDGVLYGYYASEDLENIGTQSKNEFPEDNIWLRREFREIEE